MQKEGKKHQAQRPNLKAAIPNAEGNRVETTGWECNTCGKFWPASEHSLSKALNEFGPHNAAQHKYQAELIAQRTRVKQTPLRTFNRRRS